MNHKSIFQLIFSMLLWMAMHQVQAQVSTIFTTDHTWSGYSIPGQNLAPLGSDVIMGGSWAPVEASATLPGECIQTQLNHPGTPIFSPGNAGCFTNMGDPNSNITSYFRKDFTLNGNSGPLCSATITAQGDDYFRVYVDGTLLPGTTFVTCGQSRTVTEVSGKDWHITYTFNIMPYIDLSLTTHTILFEVGNCWNMNYISASVNIVQELNCTPNPFIYHSFSGNILNIWGVGTEAGCYTHEDWTVWVKPSSGGSYTVLYSVQNSTRLGAYRNITIPPGCNLYRILHRVKYTKCDGTIVSRELLSWTIPFCTTPGLVAPTQTIVEDASGDVLTGIFNTVPEGTTPFGADVNTNLPEVLAYPNPVQSILTVVIPDADMAGEIRLIDLQGRIVFEQQATEQHLKIDCAAFPSGIYSLQVVYPDRGMSVQKVQIIHQ